jgi:hypothetical protein
MTTKERISALESAATDCERGLRHAYGQQRLEMNIKLTRIRRQIAMLTEDQRSPEPRPKQARKFA